MRYKRYSLSQVVWKFFCCDRLLIRKMADKDHIRKMITMLHIPELQKVLGLLKLSKYGKKSDLTVRLLAVSHGLPKAVQGEIESLYRQRYYMTNCLSKPSSAVSNSVDLTYAAVDAYKTHNSSTGFVPQISSQLPVYPDVKLKPLAFYDHISILLRPATLVPKSSSKCQEANFSFHFTPEQANQILQRNMKGPESVQVQMRFCWLETSCEQDDNFPPSLAVRVNNRVVQLPNPLPSNKQGVEPKRPPQALNITSLCKINAVFKNQITVAWMSEYGRNYCIAVNYVQALNSNILLARLKQNGARHPYHTRALIKEKLAVDVDSEIATTSLRISLLCPLGKMRLRIPCRATTCSHLQCFDAPTYLQMNEKKPTWMCPVCDKPAEFQSLIIDGLFTEILQKASNTNEIQFTQDGKWQPMNSEDEECWVRECPTVETEATAASKHSDAGVIDLTETDEEDACTKSSSQVVHPLFSSVVSADAFPLSASRGFSCESPIVISVDSPPHRSSTLCHDRYYYDDAYRNDAFVQNFPAPPPAHSKIPIVSYSKSYNRGFQENDLSYPFDVLHNGSMWDQEFPGQIPVSSLRSQDLSNSCNMPSFS